MALLAYLLVVLASTFLSGLCDVPPNVVFIVADDLGFNDISFHGSEQVATPNIDAIASRGVSLMRYYAQPVCSPTRASILSGRHVIHTGIYMPFDHGVTNEHLNLSYSLLPRYLSNCCNYSTRAVGKWHIGANTVGATPCGRGFDSHFGYWSGAEDYINHTVGNVFDFVNDLTPDVNADGDYSTSLFAARAVEIIETQAAAGPSAPPMFLYLAFQNIHWPLEAPDSYLRRYANATDGVWQRQYVLAMIAFLDDAVGNVTNALSTTGLDRNTVLVFVSDNGGPTNLNEGTWSCNFPLRGGKNTLWEGGTRVVGMVAGPGVAQGAVLQMPVHATDWLPTLVSMATGGADFRRWAPPGEPPYLAGDGVDVWSTIASAGKNGTVQRDWVLLEAHPKNAQNQVHGDALIMGDWKYVSWDYNNNEDGWWAPPGQDISTTRYLVHCNPDGSMPRNGSAENPRLCFAPQFCLFNITSDPCEYHDVSSSYPNVVTQMQKRLAEYQETAVPPIVGVGCQPKIINVSGPFGEMQAYQPCDAPQ